MRILMLWCPDWPVIAAGITEGVAVHTPVVVLRANRVLACSPAARAEGVRRGLRKREAQGRCPQLTVVEHDPGRDARAFEPILAAVEELAPGVEVIRPGACAVAARGPASYFGGEAAAAERLVEHIALACSVEVQAGIADGVFAALLAARAGQIVAPGATTDFLAGMEVGTLERPDLADLLRRLGVHTLADFAALPAGDVLTRFGFDAAYAHRLAAGSDDRPLAVRRPPPDLAVTGDYDPPLERVDMAAFAAKALAERLHERLAAHGLAATRLIIEAHTEAGEELQRVWRHDGLLDAAALADRVRWQLDGWLTASALRRARPDQTVPGGGLGRHNGGSERHNGGSERHNGGSERHSGGSERHSGGFPTTGVDRLRLIPDGVVRYAGRQTGLWGEIGVADERAHRALVRVQGLLGPDSVFTAVLGGGRGYADQVTLIPWGDEKTPRRPGASPRPADTSTGTGPAGGTLADGGTRTRSAGGSARSAGDRRENPPWPGRLPAPAPAVVLLEPTPLQLHTAEGAPFTVDARLAMNGVPTSAVVGREEPVEITGWAGPWPAEERWWAPEEATRLVRFQLALADGRAMLVALSDGQWHVEATYD